MQIVDQREVRGYHWGDVRITPLLISHFMHYNGFQTHWSDKETADFILTIDYNAAVIGYTENELVTYKTVKEEIIRHPQPLDYGIAARRSTKYRQVEDGTTTSVNTLYAMQFSFSLQKSEDSEPVFQSEDYFFDLSRMMRDQNKENKAIQVRNQLWTIDNKIRSYDLINTHLTTRKN